MRWLSSRCICDGPMTIFKISGLFAALTLAPRQRDWDWLGNMMDAMTAVGCLSCATNPPATWWLLYFLLRHVCVGSFNQPIFTFHVLEPDCMDLVVALSIKWDERLFWWKRLRDFHSKWWYTRLCIKPFLSVESHFDAWTIYYFTK